MENTMTSEKTKIGNGKTEGKTDGKFTGQKTHSPPAQEKSEEPTPSPDKKMKKPDAAIESEKSTMNWLEEIRNTYLKIYQNQMKNQSELYETMLNAFQETNKTILDPANNPINFFIDNNPLSRMSDTFDDYELINNYNKLTKSVLETTVKQMMDLDQKLFDFRVKVIENTEKELHASNDEMQKIMENRMKESNNLMKSNMELFETQLNQATGKY